MPDATRPAPVRPADVLNQRIRALWARARGRRFTEVERAEYHRLVVAWAAAERELVEAA